MKTILPAPKGFTVIRRMNEDDHTVEFTLRFEASMPLVLTEEGEADPWLREMVIEYGLSDLTRMIKNRCEEILGG